MTADLDKWLLDKWLKIRAIEVRAAGPERDAARNRREALEARCPGLAAAGRAAEAAEAAGTSSGATGGPGPGAAPWGSGPPPRPAPAPWPSGFPGHRAAPPPPPPPTQRQRGPRPANQDLPPPPPPLGGAAWAGTPAPEPAEPRSRWAAAADFARSALGNLGLGMTLQQAVASEVRMDVEENARSVRINVVIPARLVEHVRRSTGSTRPLIQLVALRVVGEVVAFLDGEDS